VAICMARLEQRKQSPHSLVGGGLPAQYHQQKARAMQEVVEKAEKEGKAPKKLDVAATQGFPGGVPGGGPVLVVPKPDNPFAQFAQAGIPGGGLGRQLAGGPPGFPGQAGGFGGPGGGVFQGGMQGGYGGGGGGGFQGGYGAMGGFPGGGFGPMGGWGPAMMGMSWGGMGMGPGMGWGPFPGGPFRGGQGSAGFSGQQQQQQPGQQQGPGL